MVLFESGSYRFDFGRVVLRPIFEAIEPLASSGIEDIANLAQNGFDGVINAADFDDDPINQMIEHCNPQCLDCDEPRDDCRCSKFLYKGEQGEFQPDSDEDFDFDTVMARISGAYTKS